MAGSALQSWARMMQYMSELPLLRFQKLWFNNSSLVAGNYISHTCFHPTSSARTLITATYPRTLHTYYHSLHMYYRYLYPAILAIPSGDARTHARTHSPASQPLLRHVIASISVRATTVVLVPAFTWTFHEVSPGVFQQAHDTHHHATPPYANARSHTHTNTNTHEHGPAISRLSPA